MSQQIYLPSNCSAAYQLNWSVSVFGKAGLPSPERVFDKLQIALARDDLRILEYRKLDPNVVQFFVSSQTKHSPAEIVRCVKGRWHYVSKEIQSIEFRRSVGSANSSVLDNYVARQNTKHAMADDRTQELLASLQYYDERVDTALIRKSGHGEFQNSLHLVLETDDGWQETCFETLLGYRTIAVERCREQKWGLSRIGLLSNHLHILLTAGISTAPEDVAMDLLNALASTQNMRTMFRHSYYVGTFGEFDRGAIWNSLRRDIVSEERRVAFEFS